MRKNNTVLALAVIAAVPGLMLLQQFLMPRQKTAAVRPLPLVTHQIYAATENALIYGDKRAAIVAMAAGLYLRAGDLNRAEMWCRLGAYEYRHPSIMVFYGDFLTGQKRFREACRWYRFALHQAEKNGRKEFASLVEKKLKTAVSAGGGK